MKTPVLLSWSGLRSRAIAQALHTWLPGVLQMCEPWYSENEIEAGARWLDSLSKPLSEYRIGIFCVTPENQHADWLLFEAGCLARNPDDESRVVPYLCGGLQPADLSGPFAQFQMKVGDRDGTLDVIRLLNSRLQSPLSTAQLDDAFVERWPRLEANLRTIPAPAGTVPRRRDHGEMLEEALGGIRELVRRTDGRDLLSSAEEVRAMVQELAQVVDGHSEPPRGRRFRDPRRAREAVLHGTVAVLIARRDMEYASSERSYTSARSRHDRALKALHRILDAACLIDPDISGHRMESLIAQALQ